MAASTTPSVVADDLQFVTRNVGMFPLMKEISKEVARTDDSHVAQLLTRPPWCSLLTGMVVRVQGPVDTLALDTQIYVSTPTVPLEDPLAPFPTLKGCVSISLTLLSSNSQCRKFRAPLHRRSASPSSLAFAIPFMSSHVVKSAANLGGF